MIAPLSYLSWLFGDIGTTGTTQINANINTNDNPYYWWHGFQQTINGTNGNDALDGTGYDDTIYAKVGNDVVRGFGGDDLISGDGGNDVLYGEEGRDRLRGGSGNDVLRGEVGNDTIYGGSGNDYLVASGGGGENTFNGGSDYLYGGMGNDIYAVDLREVGHVTISDSGSTDIHPGHGEIRAAVVEGDSLIINSNGSDVMTSVTGNQTTYSLRNGTGGSVTIYHDQIEGVIFDPNINLDSNVIPDLASTPLMATTSGSAA